MYVCMYVCIIIIVIQVSLFLSCPTESLRSCPDSWINSNMKAFDINGPLPVRAARGVCVCGCWKYCTERTCEARTKKKKEVIYIYNYSSTRCTDSKFTIQYNAIQLYCLCAEKFAFWLVIYIKTFNKINNKTSTTRWNTELKTAQIQGKYLTITMYTHTHAHTHASTHPPTHPHTHYSSGSPIT